MIQLVHVGRVGECNSFSLQKRATTTLVPCNVRTKLYCVSENRTEATDDDVENCASTQYNPMCVCIGVVLCYLIDFSFRNYSSYAGASPACRLFPVRESGNGA